MKPKPNWIQQADAALKRAARRAREIAARTNTPLHVMKDGKVVTLMPDATEVAMREKASEYGTKES